jgi:C4-dicarboxylate transporter DctM subunit
MASLEIGFVGMVALFAAILAGVNVMVALGLVGGLGLAMVVGFHAATSMLSTVFFETTHSFHFSVIPLFLLMGYFAMRAGLGEDLFDASNKWFGGLPGGLAISTTLGAAAFGAASGSSIPPSAVMVIFGILTDSSIGGLLIAGVIPGILFAIVLCSATLFTVWRHPEYAPRSTQTYTLKEKLYSLRLAGPLVLVIASIILGLYMGVFTPTEAGGMGAGVTLVLAVIRQRGIKNLKLLEILRETVKTSAMIFAIIICALIFSRYLALSGVANTLGDYLTSLDAPALLAITLPITHPVMMKLGFDPIWFGVFVVLLVEIGAVTPPVGVNCFVVQATSEGRVELEDVFTGLIPYVIAGFIMLFLLCVFPQLALYLPQSMH